MERIIRVVCHTHAYFFMMNTETVDLEDLEFVFAGLPSSENGMFGRPAELSAPKAEDLADLVFSKINMKPAAYCFEELCLIGNCLSISAKSTAFTILYV